MNVTRTTAEHIKRYQHDQTLPVRKERSDKIPEETLQSVINFYHRLDVSRELPGAKDTVKVKKPDGTTEVLQKKLLLLNVKEAHEVFKKENPTVEIGMTKFYEMKPKNIEHAGKSPGSMITCVCIHHENPRLAVHTSGIGKFKQFEDLIPEDEVRNVNSKDLMKFLMCAEPTDDCYLGLCRDCSHRKQDLETCLKTGFKEEKMKSVQYDRWESTDRPEKIHKTVPVSEFSKELIDSLDSMKTHHLIYKKQYESFIQQKENLPTDEVIVVGDFSENYSIPNQDEIQSAYFSHRSVTIHPFVTYYREEEDRELKVKHQSTVMVTDNLNHDTNAVATFQPRLINDLKGQVPGLRKINYWSDGAASQYKNKKNFANIANHQQNYGVDCEWNFWASCYGKGPWDGIGGTLKRSCTNAIKQGKQISTPEDVYKHGVSALPSVNMHWVPDSEIKKREAELQKRFNSAKLVKGTRGFHNYSPIDNKTVRVKQYKSSNISENKKVSY